MSYTLVVAYWSYGGERPCLDAIHRQGNSCEAVRDFFVGLYHVAYRRRILGWRLSCYKLLLFGPLWIRYEIRFQDEHHDSHYPGPWRRY
jgi:hypothetical protein